jgi:hypothetical protein
MDKATIILKEFDQRNYFHLQMYNPKIQKHEKRSYNCHCLVVRAYFRMSLD